MLYFSVHCACTVMRTMKVTVRAHGPTWKQACAWALINEDVALCQLHFNSANTALASMQQVTKNPMCPSAAMQTHTYCTGTPSCLAVLSCVQPNCVHDSTCYLILHCCQFFSFPEVSSLSTFSSLFCVIMM